MCLSILGRPLQNKELPLCQLLNVVSYFLLTYSSSMEQVGGVLLHTVIQETRFLPSCGSIQLWGLRVLSIQQVNGEGEQGLLRGGLYV